MTVTINSSAFNIDSYGGNTKSPLAKATVVFSGLAGGGLLRGFGYSSFSRTSGGQYTLTFSYGLMDQDGVSSSGVFLGLPWRNGVGGSWRCFPRGNRTYSNNQVQLGTFRLHSAGGGYTDVDEVHVIIY